MSIGINCFAASSARIAGDGTTTGANQFTHAAGRAPTTAATRARADRNSSACVSVGDMENLIEIPTAWLSWTSARGCEPGIKT